MSNNLIIIAGLLSVLAVGILILLWIDFLYEDRTGKPASERVREKNERRNGPLSRKQYLSRTIANIAIFLIFTSELIWKAKSWDRLYPFAWMALSIFYVYQLRVRWNKQQRSNIPDPAVNQLSGAPR
jgi:hypothetical protein